MSGILFFIMSISFLVAPNEPQFDIRGGVTIDILLQQERYLLVDHDLSCFEGKDFGEACDFLADSVIFFMSWPDVKERNKENFMMNCENIAVFDGEKLKLLENPTLFVNKMSRMVVSVKYDSQRELVCTPASVRRIIDAKESSTEQLKDPQNKRILEICRADSLTQSNMDRTIDGEKVHWKYRFQ